MKVLSLYVPQDPLLKLVVEKYRRIAAELTHPRLLSLEEQTEINTVPKWIYQIPGFEKFIFTDPVQRECLFEMFKHHHEKLLDKKLNRTIDYIGFPDWFPEENFYDVVGQMLCGIETKEVFVRYASLFNNYSLEKFINSIIINRPLYPISPQQFCEGIIVSTDGYHMKADTWVQLEGFTPEYPNRLPLPQELCDKIVEINFNSPIINYVQLSPQNVFDLAEKRKTISGFSTLHMFIPDMVKSLRNLSDSQLKQLNEVCKDFEEHSEMMKVVLDFDNLSEDDQMAAILTYDLFKRENDS